MKNIFRLMISCCVSFEKYDEIAFQPMRRSLLYFACLMILASALLFPKYFANQKQMIFPVLDSLSVDFPKIEFKNHELVSKISEPEILSKPHFGVVIDPGHAFRQTILFPGFWLWFKKEALEWGYQSETGQWIAYNNPLMVAVLQELAGFKEGSGILDAAFFIKLKVLIEKTALSNGIFFAVNCILLGLVSSFFLALLGQSYSKFIGTTLPWKSIRNISYYSLTPVIFFMVLCYNLDLDLMRLQTLFFVMYLLFLLGAIRRFKKPEEESKHDDFFP